MAVTGLAVRSHHSLHHDPGRPHSPFGYNPALEEFNSPLYSSPVSRGLDRQSGEKKRFEEPYRSWSGSWEDKRAQGKDFMSQRPSPQGPPASSGNDGGSRNALGASHEQQYASTSSAPPSAAVSPLTQRFGPPSGRGFELPPLPRAPNMTGGSFSPSLSRLGALPAILNPAQPTETTGQLPRRRKVGELESPQTAGRPLPPIATSVPYGQHSSRAPQSTPYNESTDRQGRRILTPRSPLLHRAASLNQLNPSSATINAQQMPFPPSSPRSHAYTIEPGTSGVPPLPTPPAGTRPSYGFPPTSAPLPRRTSQGATTLARGPSMSASPSTSYSSYSQADQTSPATQLTSLPPPAPARFAVTSDPASGVPGPADQYRSASALPGHPDRNPSQSFVGIPISSPGGASTYQMMTLETTSGTVQLPVDVQAASRVADEKRRRNAGASARFRERRKKKEIEASATISKLEQQVKELSEDMEFYKRERDYLLAVVTQTSGGERHLPRPQSPRTRRAAGGAPTAQSSSAASGYGTSSEREAQSPDLGRNVRRRTGSFPMPQASMTGNAPHPPPQGHQQPYVPPPPPPPFIPQGMSQVQQPPPHLAVNQSSAPLLPSPGSRLAGPPLPTFSQGSSLPLPPIMQASPATGPYNPFAPPRYDNRGKPPGPPGP